MYTGTDFAVTYFNALLQLVFLLLEAVYQTFPISSNTVKINKRNI
jgi:hypothetical protein